jgi:hypothetical protein
MSSNGKKISLPRTHRNDKKGKFILRVLCVLVVKVLALKPSKKSALVIYYLRNQRPISKTRSLLFYNLPSVVFIRAKTFIQIGGKQ